MLLEENNFSYIIRFEERERGKQVESSKKYYGNLMRNIGKCLGLEVRLGSLRVIFIN